MLTTNPDWQHMALYAIAAAFVLLLLQKLPYVGKAIRFAFSCGLLAFLIFILLRQAPYDPRLARIADGLGIGQQELVGGEVRLPMAPDGHFWANVSVNGVSRRMLIDSGATVTALSEDVAQAAKLADDATFLPIVMRTASGFVRARAGKVEELRIGSIVARQHPVVISSALGGLNVIGMNFLSQLQSWRVEGSTLILVPRSASSAEHVARERG